MSRPYDCDTYDVTPYVDIRQVCVLVSIAGEAYRVTFYPEGGTEVSVSMRVNGRHEWFVPNDEPETVDRVAEAATKAVGGHPFKRSGVAP